MTASAPGPVRLRPMRIGETLDAAIRLYRAAWKPLMMIVAIIMVPFTAIQAVAINAAQDPYTIGGDTYIADDGMETILVFLAIGYLVVTPILQGAVVRAVAGVYLGEHPTASESLRFALSKSWPLIVGLFLSTILTVLGAIALLIPGVILYIRYQFVVPSIVVEGRSGAPSLGRSWRLSKGAFWRILWTLLLAGIIAGVANTVLQIPGAIATFNAGTSGSAWLIQAVFTAIAQVITTPFTATVGVLLYFDARIRKEAFDLSVMSREVGSPVP